MSAGDSLLAEAMPLASFLSPTPAAVSDLAADLNTTPTVIRLWARELRRRGLAVRVTNTKAGPRHLYVKHCDWPLFQIHVENYHRGKEPA